ncbi:hypothetical protein [Arcobacter sp. F2176]|uniref:hypothetical protein n=1 Tax=Arcobacter sp. F2176 TaxID=2044511 RepID=UPI00100AB3A7|nr:hypothetical protein [Arcobacter sp. F2176]RXJ80562.1 hypothetical protein CRU95_11310 [Arcobacter sp. F2176]
MQSYDDFTASHIFYYDKNNNSIYTKDNNQKYIINDSKLKQELQDIEGYRSFIYPERKRRFISFLSAMFVSAGLICIYYLIFNELTESIIPIVTIGIYWIIHLYLPFIFHKKISNILEKCHAISEDTIM